MGGSLQSWQDDPTPIHDVDETRLRMFTLEADRRLRKITTKGVAFGRGRQYVLVRRLAPQHRHPRLHGDIALTHPDQAPAHSHGHRLSPRSDPSGVSGRTDINREHPLTVNGKTPAHSTDINTGTLTVTFLQVSR